MTITLPAADEIKAAWRRIARAERAAQPELPPAAAPEPVAPAEHVCS